MKKKTYVLMISEAFPAYHNRAGEKTGFEEKIESGLKIHTIRQNLELWQKRAKVINSGNGVLSIRKWSDKPYRSKHIELFQFNKITVQKIESTQIGWVVDGDLKTYKVLPTHIIAKNDGLSHNDFVNWFKGCKNILGCIIHFTDFRYL